MQWKAEAGIRLSTGEPWFLALSVDRVGADYVCRIEGGDSHIGAVALAEWSEDRVHARVLTARGHRETEIARHAASSLCGTTRRTVACLAGIHFDDVTPAEIADISDRACGLATRAAALLLKVSDDGQP